MKILTLTENIGYPTFFGYPFYFSPYHTTVKVDREFNNE